MAAQDPKTPRNRKDAGSIRLLVYSSLYPNPEEPRHGVFVENRLSELVRTHPVTARVVAPVPWLPHVLSRGGPLRQYSHYGRIPDQEQRHGLTIHHPRYPVVPGISWQVSPWLMYRSTLALCRRLQGGQDFDSIDAHYFYPDGVAAVLLGKALGKPVVITARGNDISLLPNHALPRKMIQWAAREANHVITVCAALRDALIELGAPEEKVTVLRNGVDLDLFRPMDRELARAELGLKPPVLLSVGHFIERKGHHIAIEALTSLPDVTLVLVGDGPEENSLRQLAKRFGVGDRVHFAGALPQQRLPLYYSAADALILASSREGWANVLLESMACGTPVIATAVWGTPEVVACPEAGVLMAERSALGIVNAWKRLLQNYPDHAATLSYAELFDWQATSDGQYAIHTRVAAV